MRQLSRVIIGSARSLVLLLTLNISCVSAWWFDNWPVWFLNEVYEEANEDVDQDKVQNTRLDIVTSRWNSCGKDSRFTFSNTLCSIKNNLYSYLQYAVYIWLAVATILLIWNGFQLVVSKDNAKQFNEFKKNMISIGIWVILLVAFYYILELFASIVNLFTEK